MRRLLLLTIYTVLSFPAISQIVEKEEKVEFGGYLSNMFSYSNLPEGFGSLLGLDPTRDHWISNHYLQNRLNLFVYPARDLKGSIQLRNRFFYGDYARKIPGYAKSLDMDKGWVDLSLNPVENNDFILNMAIDRFWFQYTVDKFEVKAGRQRINWSQTFAFNPNDIFNTYSFFEVDYPERPGTDGLRLSYYPTFSSVAEAAISLDSANRITAAALYRFNKWNYDFQFIAGFLKENDYLIGTGWSGNIKGAAFRGEATYFHPKKSFGDTAGIFVMSVSFDYMFGNSLYLQLEGLYNQIPGGAGTSFLQVFNRPMNAKRLSFTEYNLLFSGSYPVTPIINASISVMYYPKINSFFTGPSIDFSISDNLGASIYWQTFFGEFPNPLTRVDENKLINFAYARLKWNF
jgi:hypothetical protein